MRRGWDIRSGGTGFGGGRSTEVEGLVMVSVGLKQKEKVLVKRKGNNHAIN
jgi:hypothetical protein